MFCSNCGVDIGESKFCPECGTPSGAQTINNPVSESSSPQDFVKPSESEKILWEGQPAGIVDKAKGKVHSNLNDVSYKITNQRVIINSGLIGKKVSEIDMKHIKDISVKQSLTQRATGVGDIIITSTDVNEGTFKIENVKTPVDVKDIIRGALMDYRANLNIVYREDI